MPYINSRIWDVKLEDRSAWSAFLFKQLRIVIIVSRNFTKDKLNVQAASLTYYTLLSVVPLVAMAFAVAKGFGFQSALEEQLLTMLSGHEEVAEQIMVFATKMLDNTRGGVLAGVGVVVLLWSVMRLLISIELSFNDIWQVAKGRAWLRRFTEYFSIMLMAPVIVLLSSSITVVVSAEVENLVTGVNPLQPIAPLIFGLLKVIPYGLIWLLFTFVYMVMPNTKVKFSSALIAGIIAGTAFQLLEWSYIHFQVGVSKYNAIYGSFAALPLFLIWVNLSWLITLIGAEIAYANQHVSEIKNKIIGNSLSVAQQHVVAAMICKCVNKNFDRGDEPVSAESISDRLNLAYGVVSRVLDVLIESELIMEVEMKDNQPNGYLPTRNLGDLTMTELLEKLNHCGTSNAVDIEANPFKEVDTKFRKVLKAAAGGSDNLKIRDLDWREVKQAKN